MWSVGKIGPGEALFEAVGADILVRKDRMEKIPYLDPLFERFWFA